MYYKCGDLAVAEYLMQEASIKLWNKCAEVLFENVTGFLYTVSNRLFIDKIRSDKVALNFEKLRLPESNSPDPYFQSSITGKNPFLPSIIMTPLNR